MEVGTRVKYVGRSHMLKGLTGVVTGHLVRRDRTDIRWLSDQDVFEGNPVAWLSKEEELKEEVTA